MSAASAGAETPKDDAPSEEIDLSRAWLDRDIGWLEFNARVLHEALDQRTPLLERVKFLAIFSSNLDEFFMKRMALIRPMAGDSSLVAQERREQLLVKREMILSLLQREAQCYSDVLRPELAGHGVHLLNWSDLTSEQQAEVSAFFDTQISPVLTPLGLDTAHPFPYVSNLSTSWAFRLQDPVSAESILVRVKVPPEIPQWVRVRIGVAPPARVFIGLDQVIAANADRLFPGMVIESASLFRVCRDAEVDLDDDDVDGEGTRALVEREVQQRRFEPVVRLEVQPDADPEMLAELKERFALDAEDIYEMTALLDYTTLFEIAALEVESLRDPPWTPLAPVALDTLDGDIFSAIRAGDVLLHHPYESFYASVERFIREAADDPLTVSIKMTVYRVGDDTPFVRSLISAAEAGKQVACVIELKARFDEERNLHWSRELEKVGAHVVFGVSGLKTHSKAALVIRQEEGGVRAYAHIGTGNYHARTARLYEDVGLLTANPAVTRDVVTLFHFLTGRSRTPQSRHPGCRTDEHASRVRPPDRARSRQSRRRLPLADRGQAEPTRGSRHLRPPFESLSGGRAGRPHRPRLLLSGSRRPRPDRERPCSLHHRAVSRTLPDLSLRLGLRRPAPGALPDRIGRLDDPESLDARRGRGAGLGATPPRPPLGDPRGLPRRHPQRLANAVRRPLPPAPAARQRRPRRERHARDDDATCTRDSRSVAAQTRDQEQQGRLVQGSRGNILNLTSRCGG